MPGNSNENNQTNNVNQATRDYLNDREINPDISINTIFNAAIGNQISEVKLRNYHNTENRKAISDYHNICNDLINKLKENISTVDLYEKDFIEFIKKDVSKIISPKSLPDDISTIINRYESEKDKRINRIDDIVNDIQDVSNNPHIQNSQYIENLNRELSDESEFVYHFLPSYKKDCKDMYNKSLCNDIIRLCSENITLVDKIVDNQAYSSNLNADIIADITKRNQLNNDYLALKNRLETSIRTKENLPTKYLEEQHSIVLRNNANHKNKLCQIKSDVNINKQNSAYPSKSNIHHLRHSELANPGGTQNNTQPYNTNGDNYSTPLSSPQRWASLYKAVDKQYKSVNKL